MPSAINPAVIVDGVDVIKSDLRAQFAAAKSEIEALQVATSSLTRAAEAVEVVNTVTQTTLYSYPVPANTIDTDRVLRMRASGTFINNTGSSQTALFRVTYGGTVIAEATITGLTSSASARAWSIDSQLAGSDSVTAQNANTTIIVGPPGAAGILGVAAAVFTGAHATIAVNSTLAQTFTVTFTHSAASASLSLTAHNFVIELL